MKLINPSAEVFPFYLFNKPLIIKNLKKIKIIGIKTISITFSHKNSYFETIKTSIFINKYNFNVILHTPCYLKFNYIKKIIRLLKINNIRNILLLKGDKISNRKKNVINIIKKIKKYNMKIYTAAYPGFHIKTIEYKNEYNNLKQKLTAGATRIITQIEYDLYIIKYFINKIIKLKKKLLIGIIIIKKYKELEYIYLNTNMKLNKSLIIILNKYQNSNKKIIKIFNNINIELIKFIIYSKIKNIHFYTLNNIDNIINFLFKK